MCWEILSFQFSSGLSHTGGFQKKCFWREIYLEERMCLLARPNLIPYVNKFSEKSLFASPNLLRVCCEEQTLHFTVTWASIDKDPAILHITIVVLVHKVSWMSFQIDCVSYNTVAGCLTFADLGRGIPLWHQKCPGLHSFPVCMLAHGLE